MFNEYFPDIPVLPAFGNNDTKYHYQAAKTHREHRNFYTKINKIWFENHPGNVDLLDLASMETTMMQGGWYRADLVPDKLSLLTFNSLQFNYKQEPNVTSEKHAELDWLEHQLRTASQSHKFLIMMHIYETAGWWPDDDKQTFGANNWFEDEFQNRFVKILENHADKILLEVTGHDHLSDLRYHSASTEDGE